MKREFHDSLKKSLAAKLAVLAILAGVLNSHRYAIESELWGGFIPFILPSIYFVAGLAFLPANRKIWTSGLMDESRFVDSDAGITHIAFVILWPIMFIFGVVGLLFKLIIDAVL